MSTTSYRRMDNSDPRRAALARPFTLPSRWATAREMDVYGSLLSSSTMLCMGAMLTKLAPVAHAALLLAVAQLCHHQPLQARKAGPGELFGGAGGPWLGIGFALMALLAVSLPRLSGDFSGAPIVNLFPRPAGIPSK